MTKKKRLELINEAKEMGATSITLDGIRYEWPLETVKTVKAEVQEVKADELIKPISVFDQMTDEEILFWAVPHYDTIQEQKKLQQEAAEGKING